MPSGSDPVRTLCVGTTPTAERVAERLDRQRGLTVATAAGTTAGLETIAERPVDCVVSAYDLPDRDGVEFLRAVRGSDPALPFVLLPADGSEAVASEAVSAGVTEYLRAEEWVDRPAVLADRVRELAEAEPRTRRSATAAEGDSAATGVSAAGTGEPDEPRAAAVEELIADVTGGEQRLRGIREERSFVGTVLDTFEDVVYVFDTELNFVWWNDRARAVSGYTDEEFAEMAPTDFFDDEDAERIGESVQRLLETGASRVEADLVTKDGRRIPYEFRGRAITGADGETVGFCGVARDISDRVARERELERYETLVETAADGVYAQDPDGRYTYVNSYIEAVSGYDREEILGQGPELFLDEPTVERFQEAIREMVHGDREVARLEFDVETADGDRIPMEGRITTLPSDDGFAGTIGVVRDISERKERERELERQRRRLEEFASVVSHDLRNPLNVAEGRLELAREECDSDQLEEVAAAHDRMRSLIDGLLKLAREGESIDPERVDLADLAERCWGTVDTADGSLVVEAEGAVLADEGRLRQLLENLFRNAVEHGSTGSRAEPDDAVEHGSTSNRTQSGDAVEHGSTDDTAGDGSGVTVTVGDLPDGFYVADDGPGIPESERERAFEPGYSTARDGTGLGLSIVSEIAATHGWDVRATEAETGGARFEITGVERP